MHMNILRQVSIAGAVMLNLMPATATHGSDAYPKNVTAVSQRLC
jgi:hypothetical protein